MEEQIKTLIDTDFSEIFEVFNKSFADYLIPINLTEEQFKLKMKLDQTDLNISVGAFKKKKLVGFILHGRKQVYGGNLVYNGGTGVLPEERGNRLTLRMYDYIIPTLAEKGYIRIILEVIQSNTHAIKSYKNSGFQITRELICYSGIIKPKKERNDITFKTNIHYNWNIIQSFWDFHPTWQNTLSVIELLKENLVTIGAYNSNNLIGYLIFNPSNNRIIQLAVEKKFRRKRVGSSLIQYLLKGQDHYLSVLNVDSSSKETNCFFKNLGFTVSLSQFEMEKQLIPRNK